MSDQQTQRSTETSTMTPESEGWFCETCKEPRYQQIEKSWCSGILTVQRACACERVEEDRREREQKERLAATRVETVLHRWGMDGPPVSGCTFGAWDHERQPAMAPIYDRMLMFAQGFAARRPTHGVLLLGSNGTGKSHILNATAMYVAQTHRIPAIAVETPVLLEQLRPHGRHHEDFQELLDVPLLVLNDLAAPRMSEWAVERLFVLLTGRIGKCTLGSMNESPFAWAEGRIELERIRSRLEELMDWVKIPEEAVDYRHVQRRLRAEAEGREGLR